MDSLTLAVWDLTAAQQSILGVALAAIVGLTLTLMWINEKPRDVAEPDYDADWNPKQDMVAFHDLSERRIRNKFPLPNWATATECRGCGGEFVPHGFLCQNCTNLAGWDRLHSVYHEIEHGREGQAWFLASALIKDVRSFRLHAAEN